jgi:hypothetical protein
MSDNNNDISSSSSSIPISIATTMISESNPSDTDHPLQQPLNIIERLLQELTISQKQLLDDNRQLKDCLQRHEVTIDFLNRSLTKVHSTTNAAPLEHHDTSSNEPAMMTTQQQPSVSATDQAAKQLQSKRITQLLDSTPFTGSTSQDVMDWFDEFSSKCDDVKLDDMQRVSVARGLLTGVAKLWADTHKDAFIDWTTFKNKLSTHFLLASGADQFSLGQQLYNRRQQLHESAINYYHDVLRLCAKVDVNMDDDTRVKHLIKGVRPEAKIYIDLKNPRTPDDFLQALIKHGQLQVGDMDAQKEPSPIMNHRSNTSTTAVEPSRQPTYPPLMQQQQQSYSPSRSHQQPYSSPASSNSSYRRNRQPYSSAYTNRSLNGW